MLFESRVWFFFFFFFSLLYSSSQHLRDEIFVEWKSEFTRVCVLESHGHYLVHPGPYFFAAAWKRSSLIKNSVYVLDIMDSAHPALGTWLLSLFSDQEWDIRSRGLLWRMSLRIAADGLLLGSVSSAVFSPAPVPVPCSPFSDGARGLAGAPWGSCSLKDLLIPAFKGPELWPDEHQRQDAGFYFFEFHSCQFD